MRTLVVLNYVGVREEEEGVSRGEGRPASSYSPLLILFPVLFNGFPFRRRMRNTETAKNARERYET